MGSPVVTIQDYILHSHMMHTNYKTSNLVHAELGFLCKINMKMPCVTRVLNNYRQSLYNSLTAY